MSLNKETQFDSYMYGEAAADYRNGYAEQEGLDTAIAYFRHEVEDLFIGSPQYVETTVDESSGAVRTEFRDCDDSQLTVTKIENGDSSDLSVTIINDYLCAYMVFRLVVNHLGEVEIALCQGDDVDRENDDNVPVVVDPEHIVGFIETVGECVGQHSERELRRNSDYIDEYCFLDSTTY